MTAAIDGPQRVLPWRSFVDESASAACCVPGRSASCSAVMPWRRQEPAPRAQDLPPPVAKLLMERPLPPCRPPAAESSPKPDRGAAASRRAKVDKPAGPNQSRRPPVPEARNPQPNKPPGEALDNADARPRASGCWR